MGQRKKIESQEETMEETIMTDFSIDMESSEKYEVKVPVEPTYSEELPKVRRAATVMEDDVPSCLRHEQITVHHLEQPGSISDPKHVMFGGMAENATCTISVPRLRSGVFADVLTKNEKVFLEQCMGLEEGALNVYNRNNNFWDNRTEGGISKVRLTKQDMILHLDDPIEYIYYKILLANKDKICPDLQTLQDRPKATYKYVLISDVDASASAGAKLSMKQRCWVEYGKVMNNWDILVMVLETITNKPVSKNAKLEFLQTQVGELIDKDMRLFVSTVTDPLLNTKILIKKCVAEGFITKAGDWYRLKSDNSPLCEAGVEPTLNNAAKYIASPKRQQLKLSLEHLLETNK